MSVAIEIRRTDDGAILARRLDGKPLTPQDRQEARRMATNEVTPARNSEQPAVDQIIDEKVVAVLIDSTVLGAPIWFVLRDDWRPDPGDRTPVFYAHELPALQQKTPEQLRSIFNVKQTLDGGMVRQ